MLQIIRRYFHPQPINIIYKSLNKPKNIKNTGHPDKITSENIANNSKTNNTNNKITNCLKYVFFPPLLYLHLQ
jgi:hypothetical protein